MQQRGRVDAPSIVEPTELGELTHDSIAGDFRITQRRHGHRYSLDDVVTAWEAARQKPNASRCLELGSGIGSVLLMLAYKLPNAHFTAIEAQHNSFRLLERNVRTNGLSGRVELVHGDLRAFDGAGFELVTGTPPYVPWGRATPSSDAQKAFARQELRGGVEDYLAAIGRVLAADGRGVVCADARYPERAFEGAAAAGLKVIQRQDVVPRAGQKGALFSVFVVARQELSCEYRELPPFLARDEAGARTAAYHELRTFFGLTPNLNEAASP